MLFKVHHITNHATPGARNTVDLELRLRSSPSPKQISIHNTLALFIFENHDWARQVFQTSFDHVASLDLPFKVLPGQDVFAHSLQRAFELTNSTDEPWTALSIIEDDEPRTTPAYAKPFTFSLDHARSTSVGDLIEVVPPKDSVHHAVLYVVASVGFLEVAFERNGKWVLS